MEATFTMHDENVFHSNLSNFNYCINIMFRPLICAFEPFRKAKCPSMVKHLTNSCMFCFCKFLKSLLTAGQKYSNRFRTFFKL